jgi:hypothetical protein
MLASFSDHVRKKEEEKNYNQLVRFFCENITQTSTWMLILSVTNKIKQKNFSKTDAEKIVTILCSEFGIRAPEIQYSQTFSSACAIQRTTKYSNVIEFKRKEIGPTTNNHRLVYELGSALQEKTIEYRQALELVITVLEYYPDTQKHLQG